MKPAEYTVTVEKAGFDKSVTSGFILKNQQTIDLELALKVGQTSTVLEVSATAAQLATSSSMVTTNITTKQLVDLPTGRNPFSLATLSSGVIPGNG